MSVKLPRGVDRETWAPLLEDALRNTFSYGCTLGQLFSVLDNGENQGLIQGLLGDLIKRGDAFSRRVPIVAEARVEGGEPMVMQQTLYFHGYNVQRAQVTQAICERTKERMLAWLTTKKRKT